MKNGQTEFEADIPALVAAVVAVAATYFYFLIFAEFALLDLAGSLTGGESWRLRGLMVCLGGGGLIGSAIGAWRFQVIGLQSLLSWSFRMCAVAAALALGARSWPLMLLAGLFTGTALGWLTVTLAASLRPVIGTRRMGLVIGLGTGLGYALCNVPAVFEAGSRVQTVLAAVVVAAASLTAPFLTPREPSVSAEADYKPIALSRWVVIFLVLVWIDSAAFYLIQHTDALREVTWVGSRRLWANAATHLIVAWVAGAAIDRGARAGVAGLGFGLLAVGSLMLDTTFARQASLLYTAGVSAYSVMLVYFPARSGRAWQAAVIYGVAGWMGSALGIGMAQQMAGVPITFLVVAALVFGAMAVWQRKAMRTVLVGAVAVVGIGIGASTLEAEPVSDDIVARGREVYIAEGCIHCHSQYIRPGTADEARWGDAVALSSAVAAKPPLLGNRRQGPDLATVGLRLPADWQREHLMAPRSVKSGSRMPSYAYLFREGDRRGDALVAYLGSLGREGEQP